MSARLLVSRALECHTTLYFLELNCVDKHILHSNALCSKLYSADLGLRPTLFNPGLATQMENNFMNFNKIKTPLLAPLHAAACNFAKTDLIFLQITKCVYQVKYNIIYFLLIT